MKTPALALAALLVLSSAACGGEDEPATPSDAAATPGAVAEPSEDDAATEPGEDAAGSGATTLTASVGEPDDPEAYVISLVDADGQEVTELPAGDYVIEVEDPSTTHNVHLTGPGVDEATGVAETTTTTWEVTLEPGDYRYVCDPHPSMVGELTVT
ncbi:plastocyanin/azurin family copper-binding protein [uncultured Pseudokineococcus sp.]|uniref:cupredoxin domain-containing protein n=1 Tax=uncultured Pseudokineococcus sp. TaxID=1642928 RepID=UPI002639021E|nr:plastocyanin/azurin family copper-binding protein [uncultured Pseudokineococcus sp.]